MVLGYRTIFDVPGRRNDVEVVALSQLRSWLQEKNLDADALAFGKRVPLAAHATGFLQELDGGDGSRAVRARIVEDHRDRWTSTLTLHVPHDRREEPWVWVDIDGPEGQSAAIPRLARHLLEVFSDVGAGLSHLRPVPEIVKGPDADQLAEIVLDDSRRRLVFVAGSDALMPLHRWQDLLSTILRETVGLASAYVLDAAATSALNARLGETHAVAPGTVRTFLDAVAARDPLDARRHRVLTTQRILRGDARVVANVLGRRARTVALQQPLPRSAVRIDRLLERQIDELVLSQAETDVAVMATSSAAAAPVAPPSNEELAENVAETAEAILALHRIMTEVLATDRPTPEDVERVITLARRGMAAESQHATLAHRLGELQDEVEAARDEAEVLRLRLEDEQLETATAVQELSDSDRLVRHLRSLLIQTDAAAEAWAEPQPEDDTEPASFDELVGRLDELPGVVFTGRPDTAVSLDAHNPLGTWAAKTWQALLALRDYAACKTDGSWDKDVETYLRDAPAGRCTFSATRHARDESEAVKISSKFRRARELPVPASIDPQGAVFMGAHFKIAQSGLISPRLHYYDATGVDGFVYVGYIGPHLPTKQTN